MESLSELCETKTGERLDKKCIVTGDAFDDVTAERERCVTDALVGETCFSLTRNRKIGAKSASTGAEEGAVQIPSLGARRALFCALQSNARQGLAGSGGERRTIGPALAFAPHVDSGTFTGKSDTVCMLN